MANTSSAKGNPASKRMTNPNYKAKRARNKAKNDRLKEKGIHPKQLKQAEQEKRHKLNLEFGVRHGRFVIDQHGMKYTPAQAAEAEIEWHEEKLTFTPRNKYKTEEEQKNVKVSRKSNRGHKANLTRKESR